MTIRSHLMLLAIGAGLPVLAFAILVSVVLVEQDRVTVERGAIERARAMMTAVDTELRGSITTLLAITAAPARHGGDARAAHDELVRVLATQNAWYDVTLARASGEKIVDARQPFGHAPERTVDPASVAQVLRTGRVAIGNVDRFDASSPAVVPIRAPVMVDDKVAYVLTALVRPESFQALIRDQRLPDGWISGIVDANGNFVSRIPPRTPGEQAGVAFRAAVMRAEEGWYRGETVEGRDTFTAHERSNFSHWSIGLAIPATIVQAGATRTAWLMAIGVVSSIVLALGVALLLGRRIARPVGALAAVARSIGAGEADRVPVDDTVREVSDVAIALREADVAVREREQLIEREKTALQQADRAKDEFIAALSHELRNPLAALTAAAHILRLADPTHGSAIDARGVIERQTRHMTRMIEDLLDVSRLIAGKANLVLETFDLAPLVAATVGAWQAAGRFAGQSVTLDTQSAWVRADRTRLEQIVSNLLDNAVKFTPPGSTIVVRVATEGESSVLSVADDGEGIDPVLATRVFDVFVQGNQDPSRSRGGIGLGLTLVKRLAELQGGSVRVESEGLGRGATFTVRLPAVVPVSPIVATASALRSGSPAKVLIVEDNDDAREMLHQVLAMQGHDVCVAHDGTSGIALALERAPDVAIIDIGLPDIDGYHVAQRIREQATHRIALIALTGYGQPEDQRRARDAGFDLHLVKPVTVERLDHAIASLDPSSISSSLRFGD
jgi:signal transduction histidine kinase/ActR/RegA family two-component response regulator